MARDLFLGVALDGAGWHPAAWREDTARPDELLTAAYWVGLAQAAESAGLDFLTIEDSLVLQSSRAARHDERTDLVRGRLDAVMIAARVAPLTKRIGLIPSVTVTHTEPFHISKAIATLDYVSHGRAGVRVQVSARPHEAAHFGRRPPAAEGGAAEGGAAEGGAAEGGAAEGGAGVNGAAEELFAELADYVEVVRRLWDSWEDDAEIRDVATGRFVDRARLHYIDFAGRWFQVRGPSITPRPPQGQPPVVALAHSTLPYRFAAECADIALVTPHTAADARAIVGEIATYNSAQGPRVLADVVAFLGPSEAAAEDRAAHLDRLFGHSYRSDALVFVGTPSQLADVIEEWSHSGLDGVRIRPGGIPHDLELIGGALVPELRARGLFPVTPRSGTLRDRFGWARPANRYATAQAAR
jgi:alkanesulfonate monooxygenase SsuD/methylene tetrahydromethanopterin reductase-like flavin-dependent oxidoreductase (luciferase family)